MLMAQTQRVAWRNPVLRGLRLDDSGDGFKRSWIQLMPLGEYDHPQYGKLDFTANKLREFKRNFDQKVRRIDIALDQDHDGGKATGWLEKLDLKANGLWGQVRWTELGEDLIKKQIYRYFSPEFGTFIDPESGKKFSNVIIGGALTNRPFLKDMAAVQLKASFEKPGQYSQGDRDKIPDEDFAGPHQSFPIVTQKDVMDAARLIGHADDPAAVKARIKAIAKRKGFRLPDSWLQESGDDNSAAASEGVDMTARPHKSQKLAEDEEALEPTEDEEELPSEEEEEAEDESDADAESEDEESSEDEDVEEDESESEEGEDGEPVTFSEMIATLADSGKKKPAPPAKSAAKGKKPAASDAEDAADGGADEDQELDDSSSDEEYDEADGDGDQEDMPMQPVAAKGKKGAAPATKKLVKASAKKMSETQMLAENRRLSEQLAEAQATIRTLREAQFKATVATRLSEMTKHIRLSAADSDSSDEPFALPRSFKKLYESYMLDEGIRLSEAALDRLNGVILHALKVGTVPLTSLANRINSGEIRSLDDRRPRPGKLRDDEARVEEAKKIALSEHGKPLDDLDFETKLAILARLREAANRSGEPAA